MMACHWVTLNQAPDSHPSNLNNMTPSPTLLRLALIMLPWCAQAAPPARAGLSFTHHDWQLVCDNTRTCRAAGYSVDGAELPISVLLTRKAGPHQPVTVELALGDYDETLKDLPAEFKLAMRIDQRSVGQLALAKQAPTATLNEAQSSALVAALTRNSQLEWSLGPRKWQLSGKGSAAVLLKMDEFQGRIGTPGALLKKGSRSEDTVLPAIPAPIVKTSVVPKPQPADTKFVAKHKKPVRQTLINISKANDECPLLTSPEEGESELTMVRLTDSKWLVSTACWRAAYNFGEGYWVIDGTPPYHPVLVTDSGSDYSEGRISATHKGRGLGDCWSSDAWSWDGKQFVHTESSSTGMCRLIAPGGIWSLPTITTTIHPPPH